MSLSNDYKRQRGWRDWPRVFDALPSLQGQTVLDLGCGVGDQAADLAARGARVIGVDMNEDLLREARSRNLANVEIRRGDLRESLDLEDRELAFDGPASPEVVDAWRNRLDRMKLLQDFCGPDFERLREEFLGCLAHPGHRSTARVCCCIATA